MRLLLHFTEHISTLGFNLKLRSKKMDLMKVSFSSVESLNVDDIENDSVFDVKRDEGE